MMIIANANNYASTPAAALIPALLFDVDAVCSDVVAACCFLHVLLCLLRLAPCSPSVVLAPSLFKEVQRGSSKSDTFSNLAINFWKQSIILFFHSSLFFAQSKR